MTQEISHKTNLAIQMRNLVSRAPAINALVLTAAICSNSATGAQSNETTLNFRNNSLPRTNLVRGNFSGQLTLLEEFHSKLEELERAADVLEFSGAFSSPEIVTQPGHLLDAPIFSRPAKLVDQRIGLLEQRLKSIQTETDTPYESAAPFSLSDLLSNDPQKEISILWGLSNDKQTLKNQEEQLLLERSRLTSLKEQSQVVENVRLRTEKVAAELAQRYSTNALFAAIGEDPLAVVYDLSVPLSEKLAKLGTDIDERLKHNEKALQAVRGTLENYERFGGFLGDRWLNQSRRPNYGLTNLGAGFHTPRFDTPWRLLEPSTSEFSWPSPTWGSFPPSNESPFHLFSFPSRQEDTKPKTVHSVEEWEQQLKDSSLLLDNPTSSSTKRYRLLGTEE